MKPGIPWSVKGIEPEAREAAKYAARRSGMTLGEWLNSIILDQAEPVSSHERHAATAHAGLQSASPDTSIRLEDLAQQLARLTQREQDTAAGVIYEQQHATAAAGTAGLDTLSSRLDANERQTVDAFAAVNEKLNAITRQLNESQKVWQPQRPEDVPGYHALEQALRSIVDHIEVSEKRTREHLSTMQDRLSHLSQRASSAADDGVIQNAPAFAALEARVTELSARLDRDGAASRQDLPPQIETQLAQLAERIESVHQTSETAIQRAQIVAAQGARAELEDVESRIHALLKDAQFAGDGNSAIAKLHGEIESLNQRIDDLRADAASERDLHALKLAIEQLSARVAQGPDLRPLAEMEKRLAELATRFDQSREFSGIGTQLGDIDQRISDLDSRLNTLMQQGSDTESLRIFEQHIINISDRLTAAEQQFAHIGTLERSISQLFESIEQSRNQSREVAEDTANRMADRFMQAPQADLEQRGPSPELRALEEGLAAVRASAEAADQRNQETLVALHETLEQIVNRLADMELPAAADEPQTLPASDLSRPDFVPETPELPQLPALGAPPPSQRGQGPDVFGVPHDFAAPPAESPLATAAPDASAESQPATGPTGEPAFEQPPIDDFIAAARRAAQAAAQQGNAVAAASAAAEQVKKGRFKFSMPFRKSVKIPPTAALPEPPVFSPAADSMSALGGVEPMARPARRSLFSRAGRATTPVEPLTGPAVHPVLPAPGTSRGSAAARRIPLIAAGLVLLAAVAAITFKQLSGSRPVSEAPQVQSETSVSAVTLPEASLDEPVEAAATAPANVEQPAVLAAAPGKSDGERSRAVLTDDILTAALPPGKADASLDSIVAEPGAAATTGAAGVMPGPEIAPQSLREAAAKGDAAAQFIVASRYLDGQAVQQDFTEAARWYQKAASQGLAPAQYRIATLFERGKGVPLDMATARVWYERAAERGNVRAMHNVAVIYASVQSGTPDYAKAARWFSGAAEHGLKDSQYNLAVLYERGMGVKKDLGAALLWYSLAARQDDADAEKRAAVLERTLAPATVDEVKSRLAKWTAKPTLQDANVVAVSDQAWQTPEATPAAASAAPEPETQPVPVPNPVQRTQELLLKHGFNIGEPDGKLGQRTVNAIRLFELQSGMRVTGQVSDELIRKLSSTPPA